MAEPERYWAAGIALTRTAIRAVPDTRFGWLSQLLTARFGAVPEAVTARIESCGDVGRLGEAIIRIPDVATPEEIRL